MPDVTSGVLSFLTQHIAQLGVPFAIVASLATTVSGIWRFYSGRRALAYKLTVQEVNHLSREARERYERVKTADAEARVLPARLRIWNSGRQVIRRDEFDGGIPIEMLFGNADVAVCQIARVRPMYLRPEVKAQASSVLVKPLLLNPGDSIEMELVLTRAASGKFEDRIVFGTCFGTCRIAGIRWMTEDPGRTFRRLGQLALSLSLLTLGSLLVKVIAGSVPLLQHLVSDLNLQDILAVVLQTVATGAAVSTTLRFLAEFERRRRRRREVQEVRDQEVEVTVRTRSGDSD